MDYSDAGVNIELGDDASKVLYNAAKLTWENRKGRLGEVLELFPGFSGLRAVHVGGLPEGTYMNMGQGMIIATPKPDDVIRVADKHKIPAKVVGEVISDRNIEIISRGLQGRESKTNSVKRSLQFRF
jgi:phosphoribosylaminoimidazole (AIR) synthetase